MTTTRNYKRWAARQSPSLSSTANQIRLLLELVTLQPSHAARTCSKGDVNFQTTFLLPAESPNCESTKASSSPLMLSSFGAWFRVCSIPLAHQKLIFDPVHRFYRTGMCSHCKVIPGLDLANNFISTVL